MKRDFFTEKEAANKICPQQIAPALVNLGDPHTRGSDPSGGHLSEGRYIGLKAPAKCVGSECMAWRWSHQDTGAVGDPTGFCGVAGLPKYI
jgi:hypothetical protein